MLRLAKGNASSEAVRECGTEGGLGQSHHRSRRHEIWVTMGNTTSVRTARHRDRPRRHTPRPPQAFFQFSVALGRKTRGITSPVIFFKRRETRQKCLSCAKYHGRTSSQYLYKSRDLIVSFEHASAKIRIVNVRKCELWFG